MLHCSIKADPVKSGRFTGRAAPNLKTKTVGRLISNLICENSDSSGQKMGVRSKEYESRRVEFILYAGWNNGILGIESE